MCIRDRMQGIEVRADMADGFNLGGKDGGYSFGAALSTLSLIHI